MKKVISLLVSFLLIAGILVGCNNKENEAKNGVTSGNGETVETSGAKEDLQKLRVAYHPNMGGASTIITGINKGFFEEEGLEIELVKFTSGPPEIAAMVSGDIDIGYVGMGAHFLAMQGQVDIIAVDSLSNTDRVLASKESGATSIEGLKGKKVGVPLGTSAETVLDLALEAAGMEKDELKVVNMDVAGAVSAFVSGQIDAVAAWSPYTKEIAKALGEENVVEIAKNADFVPEYVFPSSWMATPKYIGNNHDTVVKFVRALIKASEYRVDNVDEIVNWTAELVEAEPEVLADDVPNMIFMTNEKLSEACNSGDIVSWFEGLQKIFMKTEKITEIVPVEDFVDIELIKEALK